MREKIRCSPETLQLVASRKGAVDDRDEGCFKKRECEARVWDLRIYVGMKNLKIFIFFPPRDKISL